MVMRSELRLIYLLMIRDALMQLDLQTNQAEYKAATLRAHFRINATLWP